MPRLAFLGSITLIALSCAALPACGQQDETAQLIARCSDPPPDQIDSCIEQVRVQQETDPSPELGKLLAQLVGRQVEASDPPVATPAPSDDNGVGTDDATPPPSPDLDNGETYEPPPQMAPPDEAPPDVQDNPADPGDEEATGPPTPLSSTGTGPVGSSSLPPTGGGIQTPPPQGDDPGAGNTPRT